MPRQLPNAETRLLGARVRAGDKRALQRVVNELRRQGGNMEATAAALGVAIRTLYLWRDTVPELGAQIEEHARGRGRPRKDGGSGFATTIVAGKSELA